ncbi:hypothetical protein PR048_029530 [Dryococelus australis]|uniref:Uncharacterized protein n=1 Tax=Dryococelus australis TaxID=614101 RepID=A0ABQ9GFW8_9NEOP|nr:hypothetical protein PR048_029530 [Dryococelus australis]
MPCCTVVVRNSVRDRILRSAQKTVAPFEFRAGMEIEIKFISNHQNGRFEISIRDQQPLSTNTDLAGCPQPISMSSIELLFCRHVLKRTAWIGFEVVPRLSTGNTIGSMRSVNVRHLSTKCCDWPCRESNPASSLAITTPRLLTWRRRMPEAGTGGPLSCRGRHVAAVDETRQVSRRGHAASLSRALPFTSVGRALHGELNCPLRGCEREQRVNIVVHSPSCSLFFELGQQRRLSVTSSVSERVLSRRTGTQPNSGMALFTLFMRPSSEAVKVLEKGRGGAVDRVITSYQGEPGSIPGGIAVRSHVGIVPGQCSWWPGFLRDLPLLLPLHSGAAPPPPYDKGQGSGPRKPQAEPPKMKQVAVRISIYGAMSSGNYGTSSHIPTCSSNYGEKSQCWPVVGEFSQGSPVSPPLHSGAAPY